jgi:hypothetical protein
MLESPPDSEGWRNVCLNDFVLNLVFKVCRRWDDINEIRAKNLTPTLYHVTHGLRLSNSARGRTKRASQESQPMVIRRRSTFTHPMLPVRE